MSTVKRVTAIAIVGLFAVAAYWYWSPYLAIRSMKNAAQERDAPAFNAFVDYPLLRANIKQQFAAKLAPKHGAGEGNIGAAAAGLLGRGFIDTMIEAMVRPEVVMNGMRELKMKPAGGARPGDAPAQQHNTDWRLERDGVNRVIIVHGAEPAAAGGFVFDRSGFASWKLTDVRLPASPPP